MNYIEEAKRQRPLIEKAVQSLPKADALRCKTLHPYWSRLVQLGKVDTDGKPGYRFYCDLDEELYECVNGNPTFQLDWVPGLETSALYTRVDEEHAGTIDDPIPADRGMKYTYGLYYLDPEDGKTYQCSRTNEADGNTVTLAYLPHEQVGQYFEEVI